MKNCCLMLVWLFAWTHASGQGAADAASIQAEGLSIQTQRQRELARYAQQEQACAAKFSVNDCLAAVKTRRRDTLAELRRQEISLSDTEHRSQAARQLEHTQSRLAQTAASSPDSSGSNVQAADRLQRKAQEKAQAQMQSDASAQARAQGQEQKKERHAEQDKARAAQADLAAINERLYQQKRAEAAQYKAELQERQREKTKPQALPLPDPP